MSRTLTRATSALALVLGSASLAYASFGYIDVPTANTSVGRPVAVAGWAVDFGGTEGPGVDAVQVWSCPSSCNGSNGTFHGYATYGLLAS